MIEGSLLVSDTVSVYIQGSHTGSGVKKTVSIECIMSQDRSRTLISELSQGISEMKRYLKRTLENRI